MSASSFAPAMLEHRVEAAAAADDASPPSYWFPLPRLARFSGAVSADAPPDEVKRAMAEAKAAISAACKQRGVALDTAYRKIGATVCVSEDGFQISVEAWTHSRDNEQLQVFVGELPETICSIFRPNGEADAHADADIDLPDDLQAQIAEEAAPSVDSVESDAPSADFSFAAAAAAASAVSSAHVEDQPDAAAAASVSEPSPEPSLVESKESQEVAAEALPVRSMEKRRLSASRPAKPAAAVPTVSAPVISAIPAAAPAASQPPPAPAVPSPALRQLLSKYAAPVTAASSADSIVSPAAASRSNASLSAPSGRFSLAAFLDQHLHTPAAGPRNHATLGQIQHAALTRTQADLESLTTHWRSNLAVARQRNPIEVAVEKQRVEYSHQQIEKLQVQHDHVSHRLHAHVAASSPHRAKVSTLQRNMSFLQHVREYESLLRQAVDLSERCKEDLTHMQESTKTGTATAAAAQKASKSTDPSTTTPSTSSVTGNLQNICVAFLKLLRVYQGLREATQVQGKESGDDEKQQAAWAGVPHLQSLVRQRLLTILHPLQSRLIQLYQQTLVELNWPQTTNTLLLGLHANPLAGAGAGGASSSSSSDASSKVTSPSTSSTSSSSSSSVSSLNASLSLFELLSENLIRVQMLLVECGMRREVRRVEREIEGRKGGDEEEDEEKEDGEEEKKSDKRSSSTPARPKHVTRLWVLTLLLQPLYKRFYYHFDSTPPTVGEEVPSGASGAGGSAIAASSSAAPSGVLTNRLDKPDWICTFLERSFSDHRDFLERLVQPIVNACGWREGYETAASQGQKGGQFQAGGSYDVCLEFLERLLSFYHAKLSRSDTLQAIISSPSLLRLTLNELIAFESKLAALYSYPIYSSRRLSLLSVFLLHPDAFAAVVKEEKNTVNRGFDRLRKMRRPWETVLTSAAAGGSGSRGEDGDDAEGLDGSSILSFDDPSSLLSASDTSFLHSSSAAWATHSAHGFLTLVDRLTGRYRSFKYLHARLHCLKEVQFKLFEIYEEDLIREFQENWIQLQENAKKGGVAKLTLMERAVSESEDNSASGAASGSASSSSSKNVLSNPLPLWSKHCGLLNSIHYIVGILKEWDDQMMFLELYFYYTHKTKIQAAFVQAHKAWRKDPLHAPQPLGGVFIPPSSSHSGEEEVLLTSEELAMWMANGGSAVMARPTAGETAKAQQVDVAADNVEPHSAAGLLPPEFRRTLAEFETLSRVINATSSSTAGGPTASPSPPPSTQLTRSTSSRSTVGESGSSSGALPLDLSISGTLFSPILAGYSALLSEMLHVLASQIVTHFRSGLKASGYVDEGHLSRRPIEPELRIERGRPLFAWATLDHSVELSQKICQPLVDLKMQLMVVHRHLSPSLHRTFWSALSSRLSPALYDDLVASKFFSRAGALRFMRDVRAVWEVCGVFHHASTSSSPAASPPTGPLLNPHFKLLSDTINILLLSRSQLHELDLELTQGSVAASSASNMRAYLSKEPYLLQKMTASQVLELMIHMRGSGEEEEEDQEAEVEQDVAQQDDSPAEEEQEPQYMDDLHLAAGEERLYRRNAGEAGHEEQEEDAEGEQQEYEQQQEEQQEYADDGQEQYAAEDQGEQFEEDQPLQDDEQPPAEEDQPPQPQYDDEFQGDENAPLHPEHEPEEPAPAEEAGEPELNLDDFGGFPDAPAEENDGEEQQQPEEQDEAYDLR